MSQEQAATSLSQWAKTPAIKANFYRVAFHHAAFENKVLSAELAPARVWVRPPDVPPAPLS